MIIHNDHLAVDIAPRGAEVLSMRTLRDRQEHAWHGDPTYWHGHAPILFPITGGMWNSTCRIHGRQYTIPKHGFARLRNWDVLDQGADNLSLAIESTDLEEQLYPWRYRLQVHYRLDGAALNAKFTVRNLNFDERMPFQLGGHPSFVLPDWRPTDQRIQGFLRLETAREDGVLPETMLRAGRQGCIEPNRVPVPWASEGLLGEMLADLAPLIPICVDTFAHEALIFDSGQVSAIEVLDLSGHRVARVSSDAPTWLVWQPQGLHAPFLCVEPWYGLPDPIEFNGNIWERPFLQILAPSEVWTGGYRIELPQ